MGLMQQNQIGEIKPSFGDDSDQKVRRQMLVALTLLLGALVLVLIKDREFWFPSAPVAQSESEPLEEAVPATNAQTETASSATPPVAGVRPKAKTQVPDMASPAGHNAATTAAATTTNRAVLPPLQVEVVSGDDHHPVQGGTSSVKVDLQPGTAVPAAPAPSTVVAQAAGRVHMSPGAAGIVTRSVEPDYPLLAKQMKVEGAVVMDALIGRDGNIQHLQILSGPKILSGAAREAVQQWRFRPFLQSGQAVESESRITVNFTIWTR